MATKLMGSAILCILVWLLRLKLTLAIGYPPMVPPISNHSEDENTTVYTVHQNETLRVSIKRVSKEFEQILYKDDKPILGLDKSNKTVYVNDSGSDQVQMENIQMYFHMKILNESHTEVIIRCITNFVEGNYYVKYDGVSLLDEPHPSRFSVRFAESLPSLRPSSSIFPPSPSLASSTQNYITESLPSASLSASFSGTPSQSLAPTTQSQLSSGSVAGIVIGIVIIVVLVVLVFYCYCSNDNFKRYCRRALNLPPCSFQAQGMVNNGEPKNDDGNESTHVHMYT